MLEQQIAKFMSHPFMYSLPLLPLMLFLLKWLLSPTTTEKNLPPSPRKLPIVGNLHQLSTLPHQSLFSLSQQYGTLMHMKFGSIPAIIVSSSEGASEIMRTNDLVFSNRLVTKLARKLLYDLKDISAAPYGEKWRQLKSIMVLQLLSNKRVQSFSRIREDEIALAVKKIRERSSLNQAVDLRELFETFASDVICMVAFGKKYSQGENGKKFMGLLRGLLEELGSFYIGDFIPRLSWIDWLTGHDAKVEKIAKEIDVILEGVVQEHLQKPSSEGSTGDGVDEQKGNFVEILLKIQKEGSTGIPIDGDSIKGVLLDTYAAGTDTTSTVLEWVMTELLRHPTEMKKLQYEIRQILAGRQHITDDDLEKMNYLRAVIKETFRLHTPLPLLVPRVAGDDVKVMGYDIAKGTMVIINAWAIGKDPKVWDDPEEFRPVRFMNCSIDYKGFDFELIPFGSGRRGCPGIAFAAATIGSALANLLQKFDWEFPNGENGEDLDMTEAPGGIVRRKLPLLAAAMPFPS